MAEMNKMTIVINGIRYAIRTAEEPDYVEELARGIDTTVRELMAGGTMSLNDALVLTALSSMDAHRKAEHSADNLRAQVTGYVEDAAKARLEVAELKREIERLERRSGSKQGSKA